MAKVKSVKLLSLTLPNKVGQLAAVAGLLGDAGVNISAFRGSDAGSNAEIVFAVKNTAKAKKALMPLGVEVREIDALCVETPNKAGRLRKVAQRLADAGVNIHASWATAFTGKTAGCVLMTSDDKKAMTALKKK